MFFKSEQRLLLEWIDYHTLIGIDHFYICQDVCSDIEAAMTRRLLHEHILSGLVTLYDSRVLFPNTLNHSSSRRQRPFYDLILTQLKVLQDLNKYDWMACLDIDDFLVPKVHGTLPRLLSLFDPDEITGIMFNGKLFGCGNSSDIPIYTPSSVIASSQSVLINERVIKSIGSVKSAQAWHAHHPVGDKPIVNPHGQPTDFVNPTASYNVAFYAHYVQPSLESLNAKWRDADYPYPDEDERRRSRRDIAMNKFTNNTWINYPKKDTFDPDVKSTEVFDLYNLRKADTLPEIPELYPVPEHLPEPEQQQTEQQPEPEQQEQQQPAPEQQSEPEQVSSSEQTSEQPSEQTSAETQQAPEQQPVQEQTDPANNQTTTATTQSQEAANA
jgi:hypothetical protein